MSRDIISMFLLTLLSFCHLPWAWNRLKVSPTVWAVPANSKIRKWEKKMYYSESYWDFESDYYIASWQREKMGGKKNLTNMTMWAVSRLLKPQWSTTTTNQPLWNIFCIFLASSVKRTSPLSSLYPWPMEIQQMLTDGIHSSLRRFFPGRSPFQPLPQGLSRLVAGSWSAFKTENPTDMLWQWGQEHPGPPCTWIT